MVKEMTSGKPLKLILSFAVPLILGNVLQQMYSWADTMMVGKLISNEALAAVGATGAITFLILGFVNGVAEGSCILLARYFGAGDHRNLKKCAVNVVVVCTAVVAILTALALKYNRQILEIMKTPDNIIEDTEAYLQIIYAGMFALLLYNLGAGILRALGDSRSPLYFLIIASVLNIILNYVLIVFFSMGVRGAAYGTIIAQLVSGVLCFIYIFAKCSIIKPGAGDIKLSGNLIMKICIMGIPMALQYSITAIGSIFLQTAINNLGSNTIAAFTVGEKVLNFSWAILNCIGVALANYCSQNVGAMKIDRVKSGVKATLRIILLLTVVFMFVLLFFGKYIAMLFLENNSDEVLKIVEMFFRIQAPCLLALSMIGVFRNVIQGVGYSLQAMLAGIFELVGRSSIALIFVGKYGFVAACVASPCAWILADFLLIPMYFYVMRKLSSHMSKSLTV